MLGYEELYEKYQKLLEENKRLRIENEDYKEQLGLVLPKFDIEIQNKKEILSHYHYKRMPEIVIIVCLLMKIFSHTMTSGAF